MKVYLYTYADEKIKTEGHKSLMLFTRTANTVKTRCKYTDTVQNLIIF